MKPRKPRKPRLRDLPPEEQANRWWESYYIGNSCLTDEGLFAVLKRLYWLMGQTKDPCLRRYHKTLLHTLKQRGLEERATAHLVAERLKGEL